MQLTMRIILWAGILGISTLRGLAQKFDTQAGQDPGNEQIEADPEGWVWLFDGSNSSAENHWWISGATKDGDGGKWWVAEDPELVEKGYLKAGERILWSDQNPGGEGGVLCTHRRYGNVEVIVSFISGWRNDGGLFLRTNAKGNCFQIMYDYQPGNTVGGYWPEGIKSGKLHRMYTLSSETQIKRTGIPWDEPWSEVWDPDGFNEVFSSAIGDPPQLTSWIKEEKFIVTDYKPPSKAPELDADGMGYIGLQVHADTRAWQGGPNKYKWIKVREIDDQGQPLYPPLAPTIFKQPVPVPGAVLGGKAVLAVEATWGDKLKYQWQKDGVDIPGATRDTLTLSNLQASDLGEYAVVLKNQLGDAATTSEKVKVGGGASVFSIESTLPNGFHSTWGPGNSLKITGHAAGDYVLSVMDVSGKALLSKRGPAGPVALQLPGPGEGVFFIRVITGENVSVHKIMSLESF